MINIKKVLDSNRKEIIISVIIYVIGIIVGGILTFSMGPEALTIKETFDPHYEATPIISNNLKGCLFLILGFFLLGLSTFFILFYNGVILGEVSIASLEYLSMIEVFLRIIPHGILEIPAIIFASAVGFKSVTLLIASLRGKRLSIYEHLGAMGQLMLFAILLIVLAGFVEAYITTLLL